MAKTRLQFRQDLRLDLKDSGSLWSDTELNRCIERAFSDLSRFLPDEKVFEDSLQFTVTGESVVFPADTSATAILNAKDISGSSAGDTATIAGQPDVPRPLRITITDANGSLTGLTLIIDGIDKDDQSLQEIFHYTLGDDKAWDGLKYFKAIYNIEIDQIAGAGASDTLSIGYGPYTDVWVYLANSPIKWQSESATDTDSNNIVRNTDFFIDYGTGRVKAISGGGIVAAETSTFAYKKSQIGIDLSGLADLIRVQRVEYPVGQIPQVFITGDTFGKWYVATGSGESGDQVQWAEDEQYRIYYDARHQVPGEYSPSSAPAFLEDTVMLAAGAYALYIYALKHEHQVLTDLASARTSLGSANGDHSAFALALTSLKKYLDNNSEADAVGILKDITDDVAELRTKIVVAEDLINSTIDTAITDLGAATTARANYMGATANYVDGGTEPDIKAYLSGGDALLNTNATGGEGTSVPDSYAKFAQVTKDALVGAHEQDRRFYQQNATTGVNAAMAAANEVAQRLSMLRSYIEESAGYVAVSSTFAREAEDRIAGINTYLQQAGQYTDAANSEIATAERFKAEADERRNEAYSIWRDRKQYIGDFTAGAVRQYP